MDAIADRKRAAYLRELRLLVGRLTDCAASEHTKIATFRIQIVRGDSLGEWRTMSVTTNLKHVARAVLPAPVYRRYRQARVARLISGYEPRVVEHVYCGFPLRVNLGDPLAQGWYDHDWEDRVEIALARRTICSGDRVFDIGAHQCVVAMVLARLAGEGHVVAIEGEPHNAAMAVKNVELNQMTNVTVVHSAINDTAGEVLFAEGLNGHVEPGNPWGKVRVPAVTIDDLTRVHGQPDFVLLDVEGFEAKALKGAGETLAAGATFLIELHVGQGLEDAGSSASEVVELLRAHGYGLAVAVGEKDGWLPLTEAPRVRSFVHASGL